MKNAYRIFPPSALAIYRIGLSLLMNGKWMPYGLRDHVHRRMVNNRLAPGILGRTLPDGILYVLGAIFFDQLWSLDDELVEGDAEKVYIKASSIYQVMAHSGCRTNTIQFAHFFMALDGVDEILTETPPNRVNSVFIRQGWDMELWDAFDELNQAHANEVLELRHQYARNFAERAFHDRQLCEYITFGLASMHHDKGIPVVENGVIVVRPARRVKWPAWVLPTLRARERDRCANCGSSFSELESEQHIDHIVAIKNGGSNDLVNLQLLCDSCNVRKSSGHQLVKSSVPAYLSWQRRFRKRSAHSARG